MPHAVEFDQEFAKFHIPAKSESPQARYNARSRVVIEYLLRHFLSNHRPDRVTIMVYPEAPICAQCQLDVGEAVRVREAGVDFTGKGSKNFWLAHRILTKVRLTFFQRVCLGP